MTLRLKLVLPAIQSTSSDADHIVANYTCILGVKMYSFTAQVGDHSMFSIGYECTTMHRSVTQERWRSHGCSRLALY